MAFKMPCNLNINVCIYFYETTKCSDIACWNTSPKMPPPLPHEEEKKISTVIDRIFQVFLSWVMGHGKIYKMYMEIGEADFWRSSEHQTAFCTIAESAGYFKGLKIYSSRKHIPLTLYCNTYKGFIATLKKKWYEGLSNEWINPWMNECTNCHLFNFCCRICQYILIF